MATCFVFSSTGRVGGRFATLAVADGHDVLGLTRSDANGPALEKAGITPVVGDIRNPAAYRDALQKVDVVFLASADATDQDTAESGVLTAIKDLGRETPPHVVKLSAQSAGLNPPRSFGVYHRRSEQALEDSGLPYTILRPTFFQESLLLFADDIAKKGKFVAPAGKGRIAMVGVDDIARTGIAVAGEPAHQGKIYTLTGPSAHSLGDVAQILSSRLDRKVGFTSPPAFVARIVLPFVTGMPRWQSNLVVDLLKAISEGAQERVHDDVAAVTGSPARSLEAFLEGYLDPFRKSG